MRYRRVLIPGGTFFFTLVTEQRRKIFDDSENVDLLRDSFQAVAAKRPFTIDAIVIMPDHIHCVWTLPPDDIDYSTRWRLIKTWFTKHCDGSLKPEPARGRSERKEQAVWQHRYFMIVTILALVVLGFGFSRTGLVAMMVIMVPALLAQMLFFLFAPLEAALSRTSGVVQSLRVSVATVRANILSTIGLLLMLIFVAIVPALGVVLSTFISIWLMPVLMAAFFVAYSSFQALVLTRAFIQWRREPGSRSDRFRSPGGLEELSEPAGP